MLLSNLIVPIGTVVQFFPGADKGGKPVAGIVVDSSPGGHCKLNLLYPGGGETVSTREFCRHISDPWIRENPDKLRQPRHGVQLGAWDFVPSVHSPVATGQEQEALNDAVDRESRKEEGRKEVDRLMSEGVSLEDAVKKVRRFGLSRAEVEQIFRDRDLALV